MELATLYQPSKGPPKAIADLPFPYLVNACEKLKRDQPHRAAEILAMQARIDAEADAEIAAGARKDPEETPNPRAVLGNNNPPEPTPVEALAPAAEVDEQFAGLKAHFDDLYTESKNWADGAEVENEAQAAEVDRLLDEWKKAIATADSVLDARIDPLNAQIKVIRELFYPLTGDTTKIKGIGTRAKTALLQVKTAWGKKVQARIDAEAAKLAKEAADKAQQALEASRAAVGDLAATESAEDLIKAAQGALRAATTAGKATPGKGYRTKWVTTIADNKKAVLTMMGRYPQDFLDLALRLAEREVMEGKRVIDGFLIDETKVAVG
jgi:hypothetical protein